jgi:Flp pilus assembly protein TadG
MCPGKNRRRGAALLEFVLVAALCIFLLFGIIEMGFLFSNSITVTSAAHQGARAAALGQSASAVTSSIKTTASTLRKYTDSTYLQVATEYRGPDATTWTAWTPGAPPPDGIQDQVRVTVTYRYDYITGALLGGLGGCLGGSRSNSSSCTLTGRAVMRYGG